MPNLDLPFDLPAGNPEVASWLADLQTCMAARDLPKLCELTRTAPTEAAQHWLFQALTELQQAKAAEAAGGPQFRCD